MDESQLRVVTAATAKRLLVCMVAHSTTRMHLFGYASPPNYTGRCVTIGSSLPQDAGQRKTSLIDRTSRDSLIELLNDFAANRILRQELFAPKPASSDRAVREIIAQALLLERSDDDSPGSRNLTGEDRGEVARWVLFLQTDAEYRWPSLPTWLRVAGFIPSILTFGWIWRPYRRWYERQGDHRVWPFLDSNEHNAARRKRKERHSAKR